MTKKRYTQKRSTSRGAEYYDSLTNQWVLWSVITANDYSDSSNYSSHSSSYDSGSFYSSSSSSSYDSGGFSDSGSSGSFD